MVSPMMKTPLTKAVLTRKAVGLVGAIAAGIGLWRFTSGDWLSGIVFVAAVAGLTAWYFWSTRRVRDGRRY
jgi:membrane protein implicated in regulation of membrane protease activity